MKPEGPLLCLYSHFLLEEACLPSHTSKTYAAFFGDMKTFSLNDSMI